MKKKENKTTKKYPHIGLQGKHQEIDMFRGICKIHGYIAADKIIDMLKIFNQNHKEDLIKFFKNKTSIN